VQHAGAMTSYYCHAKELFYARVSPKIQNGRFGGESFFKYMLTVRGG
jgi:hypothetical protein